VAVDDEGIGLAHEGLSKKDAVSLMLQRRILYFYRNILVMSRILIINPNTTASITALLKVHAEKTAGVGVNFQMFTAQFGAPYISCEVSYAVAGHAVLDAWASVTNNQVADQASTAHDAVLIGCFGDPGLLALRDASPVHVTGLAEASFIEAAKHGRFAIVTGGSRWKPMLERLASSLGFSTMLAGITTVAPSGAQLAQDPIGAQALLATACQQAVKQYGAQAVILGGAGLADMAELVQTDVGVPVIDSVVAGVRQAMQLTKEPQQQKDGRLIECLPWLARQ
jgi:Asp/Glu/hydantoin racemase